MAKRKSDLSQTEWSIMKICWEKGEATARTVFDESLKERKREYQTIKTMLDRLVKKGYLQRRKFGPLCLYKPAESKAKAVANAIDNFASTVLDHTFAPLVTHFAKKKNLKPEELDALKELIKKHKE